MADKELEKIEIEAFPTYGSCCGPVSGCCGPSGNVVLPDPDERLYELVKLAKEKMGKRVNVKMHDYSQPDARIALNRYLKGVSPNLWGSFTPAIAIEDQLRFVRDMPSNDKFLEVCQSYLEGK